MYGTCEDAPDKNPQRAGQITELSGNNRAYERACASDSCEVMAEYDVFVRRNIVVAVFETECGVTLYWFSVNTLAAMNAP